MGNKRKIEIYSAGCPACDEAIQIVNGIACSSCDIEVVDMHQPNVAARAQQLGVKRVPAVVKLLIRSRSVMNPC
jgi:glutaredoxin 3